MVEPLGQRSPVVVPAGDDGMGLDRGHILIITAPSAPVLAIYSRPASANDR
jgi:hypothetical protein